MRKVHFRFEIEYHSGTIRTFDGDFAATAGDGAPGLWATEITATMKFTVHVPQSYIKKLVVTAL